MTADAASLFLNETEHAESLSFVRARGTDAVAFTGVFDIKESFSEMTERGKEFVYVAEIHVGSDVAIRSEDTVRANDVEWQVTGVNPPQYGLKTVHCEYRTTSHRKPKGAI